MATCVDVCFFFWVFGAMTTQTPVNTKTVVTVANPNCPWWREAFRLNPFGCFEPSFVSRSIETTQEACPKAPPGACGGSLVTFYFDEYRGDDMWVSFAEAGSLADAVSRRVAKHATCGIEGGVGAKPCFSQATKGGRLDAAGVGSFVGCLLGHEPAECRAIVCGSGY